MNDHALHLLALSGFLLLSCLAYVMVGEDTRIHALSQLLLRDGQDDLPVHRSHHLRPAASNAGALLAADAMTAADADADHDGNIGAGGPLPPSAGWLERQASVRRALGVHLTYTPTRPRLNHTLRIAVDSCIHSTCDFLKPGLGVGRDCPYDCQILGDAAVATADVVVASAMEMLPNSPRPAGQIWVGAYQESPDHYALLRGGMLDQYDYTYGYSPYDDFVVDEHVWDFVWHAAPLTFELPSWESKRTEQPWLSAWISNCAAVTTDRVGYLQQLRKYGISVASYGKCGNTHAIPTLSTTDATTDEEAGKWAAFASHGHYEQKITVSAHHLFFFAAENSACAWYHTEKVMHGLLSGSIPIYLGASETLSPLVPEKSVIYADDFARPQDLAKYLQHLATDEEAYMEMLAWRHKPLPVALQRLIDMAAWEYDEEGGEGGGGRGDRIRCEMCGFLHQAPRRSAPRPPPKCPARRKRPPYQQPSSSSSREVTTDKMQWLWLPRWW